MAHALTLTAIDDRTALTLPQDGDDLDAAVVEAYVQQLGDRSLAASTALVGSRLWSGLFGVRSGGSLTAFTLDVGAISALYLADSGGTYRVGDAVATTIGVSKVEGAPGTLGAVARWWYVYAFLTTLGVVDYAISLTGPSEDLRFKAGDATRAYLGCFRTTAAGTPLPGRKAAGRWVYRRSALASNETRVLNASASAGPADLDLSALVPPHAVIASLALACVGGDGGFSVWIACDGDTSDIALFQRAEAGLTSPSIVGDVECWPSQIVDCTTVRSGTTGVATAYVHGFYE